MQEKVKIELTPASINGYTFTQEEKDILKQDNSKRIIATMLNNSSLNLSIYVKTNDALQTKVAINPKATIVVNVYWKKLNNKI